MSWPPCSLGRPPPDSLEEGSNPQPVECDRLPSSSPSTSLSAPSAVSSSPSSSSLLPLLPPSDVHHSNPSSVQEQALNLESRTTLRSKALSSTSLDIEYRPYPPPRSRPPTSSSSLTITAVRDTPIPSPRLYRLPPDHSTQTHFTQGSLIQLAGGGMKKVSTNLKSLKSYCRGNIRKCKIRELKK